MLPELVTRVMNVLDERVGRSLDPSTLKWSDRADYPIAGQASMAPLAELGVYAIEFFQNTYWHWASLHLKDGRHVVIDVDFDLNQASARIANGSRHRDDLHNAARFFLTWANHNHVLLVQGADGDWSFARRPENAQGVLVHPDRQGWSTGEGLVHTTATMTPYVEALANHLARDLFHKLPRHERKALAENSTDHTPPRSR